MADPIALVTSLADELEYCARRDHYDATGNHVFETCSAHLCTKRRALLGEARTFAATPEEAPREAV